MAVALLDPKRLVAILGTWAGGRGPLYQRLEAGLAGAIERGELSEGTRLPPERALAQALSLSRSTVVTVYDLLAERQLVERRRGSGTFVRALRSLATSTPEEQRVELLDGNVMFRQLVAGAGEIVDFTLAAPLPAPAVVEAFHRAPQLLVDADALGHGYVPAGLPALRSAIAAYLTDSGIPTAEAQVLVTTGGQQAISLIASLYLGPGDGAVVEDPGYAGALDVFRSAGARLFALPTDQAGARVDLLGDVLMRTAPRLVYVTSSFNTPTGSMLSSARREQLVGLAEDFQIPIVEDIVQAEIVLTDRPLPLPAASLAGSRAPILLVGSMSKLFWGGLRIGWIRAPEHVIFRLAQVKAVADLGSPVTDQAVAVDLLRRAPEVRRWRLQDTRSRFQRLTSLVAELLPSWSYAQPDGGYALWCRLPGGSAADFLQVALRHGVTAAGGSIFSVDGSDQEHVRLPFVLNQEVMAEGVARLARAWQTYSPQRAHHPAEAMAIV